MTSNVYLNGVQLPSNCEPWENFILTYAGHESPHSFDVIDYEDGVISAHEIVTNPGDDIVVVGGGYGITTVRSANITGETGSVTVYEGGKQEIETIGEITELNDVEGWCEANHAIVGQEKDVYGDSKDAKKLLPSDIPECDVLELDCEGSEIEILKNMDMTPEHIIVELHPWQYPDKMNQPIELLQRMGYDVFYKAGHDGIKINDGEFEKLLTRSCDRKGEHDPDKSSEKYLQSGARWPVVVAGSLT